jgi:hypothetical protein
MARPKLQKHERDMLRRACEVAARYGVEVELESGNRHGHALILRSGERWAKATLSSSPKNPDGAISGFVRQVAKHCLDITSGRT